MHPHTIRVFVVDDEPMIARSLAEILRHNGYQAAYYVSPEEALRDAEDDPPDLVISDVRMPGMSGVELAEKLRVQVPGCRIILFSAQAYTDDLFRKLNSRSEFSLLSKPVLPAVLLAEVQHVLAVSKPV